MTFIWVRVCRDSCERGFCRSLTLREGFWNEDRKISVIGICLFTGGV